MNNTYEIKDLETELLQDFSLIKMTHLTLKLKLELDEIPVDELDQLVHAFNKVGGFPDEILFLKSLVALKMTKKNLEVNHFFNRQVRPLAGAAVKE